MGTTGFKEDVKREMNCERNRPIANILIMVADVSRLVQNRDRSGATADAQMRRDSIGHPLSRLFGQHADEND